MMIKIKAEYALYINPAQITEIYQDHNGRWHADLSSGGDVAISEKECRQILGITSHQTDPASPGVPIVAVLGPDGRDTGRTMIGDLEIPGPARP